MTNIEKWLIQKGFDLKTKEVKYYPLLTETVLTYTATFYSFNTFEAKVYLFDPLKDHRNCCEIKATSLYINRLQTNVGDNKDIYASRKPEVCNDRAKQALFLLNLWAEEMDGVEDPFDEVKE